MDFSKNIAENIKSLRESQHITQERLANALGISYQAVSKWENSVTTPDVLMIPLIAQYFGVSIDDLFKSKLVAYDNNAIKWLAKYEASHNQDDFIRADIEFRKLFDSGNYEDNDIRSYGILYEYHMYYCKEKALEEYDKIISNDKRDEMYYRVCRQKSLLLSRIGRSEDDIVYWEERIKEENSQVEDYTCLVNSCYWAKEYKKGMDYYEKAIQVISENNKDDSYMLLYTLGGDIYKELKKYDDAFVCWEKALEVTSDFVDPLFSIGFCHEEIGDYEKAAETWKQVIDFLTSKGFTYELNWPRELLNKAEAKINRM